MTTFTGSKTPITLLAVLFKSSRILNSNKATSIIFSRLETPTVSIKLLIDAGVYPRLLNPEIVGILGSSHPETIPSSTKRINLRLLIMV